jgi:hypothetical protein
VAKFYFIFFILVFFFFFGEKFWGLGGQGPP